MRFAGQPLHLAPLPPMRDLITDRSITIFFALIVPDALFEQMSTPANTSVYWNFRIPPALTEQFGLMLPIKEASDLLAASGLQYESNLQNFARQLFYAVAGSYTLLYLGFLFLLIGCTVLALQFLTQMRQTNRRYLTLGMLGANRAQMRHSLYAQVAAYFLLPLALACINAVMGLWALLSLIYPYLGGNDLLYLFAIAMAGAVILIEVLYAFVTARSATHGLEKLLGRTA
jgi:putative ABC transport system permease protein